jgi:hypothetical protein
MSMLAAVQKGRVSARPLRALVYGCPGVGKSTFAAGAPAPLFLDAEQGTLGLDVARLPIHRWADFSRAIDELQKADHPYRTIVLDTLDALDRLLVAEVADGGSIEDVGGGFGKGWTQVAERWGRAIEELEALQARRRVNLIALAHANVETFRDPAGADYQRWNLRVPKKSAALWVGWVDELLLATRDVTSGRKDKGKGRGGERVLYTKWAPGRECKNRRDLPERMPLDWPAFAAALRANVEKPRAAPTPDAEDRSMDAVDAPPPEEAGPVDERPLEEQFPAADPPPPAPASSTSTSSSTASPPAASPAPAASGSSSPAAAGRSSAPPAGAGGEKAAPRAMKRPEPAAKGGAA